MMAHSRGRKRCVAHRDQAVENEDAKRLWQCMIRGLSSERPVRQKKAASDCLPSKPSSSLATPKTEPQPSSSFPEMRREENATAGDGVGGDEPTAELNAALSQVAVPMVTSDLPRRVGTRSFVRVVSGDKDDVSAQTFYGSSDARDKPREFLRLLKKIRETLEHSPAALPESSASEADLWVTFPRQDMAFQFADSHGADNSPPNLRVFVYQDHLSATRRFLVTTVLEFWRRYSTMPAVFRHHYEVIREGWPCHLYFDLEFDRVANPSADGHAMVTALLLVLADLLQEVYAVEYDESCSIELDSSTPEKFSVHLIVHIPGAAFKNNAHVGSFVKELSSRVSERREEDARCAQLFVRSKRNEGDPDTLFLDEAVYSRNRHFRLALSSKAGKAAILLPTSRFRCQALDNRDVFMESLICLPPDKDQCSNLLTFGTEVPLPGGRSRPSASSHGPKQVTGRSRSPFPAVDEFIEYISSVGDVSGTVRSWVWFEEFGCVVFNIAGNRFCENIGRPHKSNNVMYAVSFRMGGYYQMCHDPDCRGYRSDVRPIPRHLLPADFPSLPQCSFPELNSSCPSLSTQCPHCHDTLSLAPTNATHDRLQEHTCTCHAPSAPVPTGTSERMEGSSAAVCDGDAEWWDEVITLADEAEARRELTPQPSQQSALQTEAMEVVEDDGAEDEWWVQVIEHYGHVSTL